MGFGHVQGCGIGEDRDSDMYKGAALWEATPEALRAAHPFMWLCAAGAQYITTLSEKLWERRLIGDSIWLVKCYAAWCPACKANMPQYHSTAELLKDESEVEVGAINCEKPMNTRIW